MPQRTLIFDGLWRCLCPSLSRKALRSPRTPLIGGKRGQFPSVFLLSSILSTSPRRCLSTSRRVLHASKADNTDTFSRFISAETPSNRTPSTRSSEHSSTQDADTVLEESSAGEPTRKAAPGSPNDLEAKTTPELEQRLQEIAGKAPRIMSVLHILRILMRDRQIRPEARHYKALILANSDCERGSPEAVRQLLAEMEENDIPADSGTLHAALQALAVHPDYILRQEILRKLRDRWLPLSPAGWHHVVAGLVREHQFELALDHIAHMERKDIMIEGWLYSMVIYYLCEFNEFDEILRLMRSRTDQGHDMSLDVWQYVLGVASAAFHHEATLYIWRQMVELGYMRPPYEICKKVLAVASRTGDVELGSSVIRFLAETDVKMGLEDFEKMVEAHVVMGDLFSAFEVLCRMHKTGIKLEQSSTRAILNHMVQTRIYPRKAWGMLKKLKAAKHEIPLGCARVVIEMCEHEALDDPFIVDEGVEFYKELYALCPEKADVSIYNTLIGMCRRGKNTDAGMFVVKEMATLGVVPNAGTFEHLIIMCLEAGNSESAYMYFQDLLARNSLPSEDARHEIHRLCSRLSDQWAVRLRDHPELQIHHGLEESGETATEETTPSQTQPETSPEHWGYFGKQGWKPMDRQARIAYNKERRKRKRRRIAIARNQEEEGWVDYEPGGLVPELQLQSEDKSPTKS